MVVVLVGERVELGLQVGDVTCSWPGRERTTYQTMREDPESDAG